MSDTPALRKERGAFFTPAPICEFLSAWAIASSKDRVLEPSCGEARFLVAAAKQVRALGGRRKELFPANDDAQLLGVEIHPATATDARRLLADSSASYLIEEGDFLATEPAPEFDVVLGNPPFVRYQNFSGDSRERGLRSALAAGVNLSGLSSSWAPFLIHSTRFLKPSGRLGMVLPAELLAVQYAGAVRRFLLKRFARIQIVVFEKLVFEDALENVVLLMAEGTGGCDRIEVLQVRDASDLLNPASSTIATTDLQDDKWTATLMRPQAWKAFVDFAKDGSCELLQEWGSPYLGSVTGDNAFFCLSDEQVKAAGLTTKELLRISPPGSKHLKAFEYGTRAWDQAREDGKKCWLFYPKLEKQSESAKSYIRAGEKKGIQNGFKCSNRKPWWRVPLVEVPDLFLTYMDHERPRFVNNTANLVLLNSLYGIKLASGRKQLGKSLLPIASLNSLTLLGAEVHGRSYGGGLLKLEPRDAGRIPVPSLEVVKSCRHDLTAVRPQVAYALSRGDVRRAVEMVDSVLWTKDRVPTATLDSLRESREFMFQRRRTRGQGADRG